MEGSSPRFANRLYFDRYLAQAIPTETFRTQMSGMRSKGLPMASKKTLRNCSMTPMTTAHTMC